jgi:hypothetical protein
VVFRKLADVLPVPAAAGGYRPEAFTDNGRGAMIPWGISIRSRPGLLPFLQRFDCDWSAVPGLK